MPDLVSRRRVQGYGPASQPTCRISSLLCWPLADLRPAIRFRPAADSVVEGAGVLGTQQQMAEKRTHTSGGVSPRTPSSSNVWAS